MTQLALGLMSGTSADGLSIALASFKNKKIQLKGYAEFPYPKPLAEIIRLAASLPASALSQLNFSLGHFFADKTLAFLKKEGVSPAKVSVIGSHGQTVYHGPRDRTPNTLQIAEPAVIAEKTGITVVADFRPRDIAAGGEGAPLVPFFDQTFFSSSSGRALQNIGGIANVTFVKKGARTLAFDNGPGNTLLDHAVRRLTRGNKDYDHAGAWARRGQIIRPLAKRLAQHPYFKKRPPKSTGPELWNETLLPAGFWKERPEDILATLTYFTAWAIADSYKLFAPFQIKEIVVSGGGALNLCLLDHLSRLLAPARVVSIEKYGVPVQAKEPLAFAYFGLCALQGKINHLPAATGAQGSRVLGKIIPGNTYLSLRGVPPKGRRGNLRKTEIASPARQARNDGRRRLHAAA